MSTVLLMTDSWQPTVLRLVPFSSNNARVPEKKNMAKANAHVRNFPMLAVTRSSVHSDEHSDVAVSNKSEQGDDVSVYSETNVSVITTNTVHTARTSTTSRRQKYARKKVPDTHSEMKEAIKFSVQDLNDQIRSTSSLQTPDGRDDTKEKLNKKDYTRTQLPKPSLCPSPDTRFCSPVNGVRRSVPLTPGEMELQRIRDSYYVEQVQKRKKYKLNINQLPRSTTPINDHDPDKLNMKQVIAFLQTKTSQEIQKKILNDKRTKSSASRRTVNANDRPVVDSSSSPTKRIFAKDNVKQISRSNTELTFNGSSTPDNTRVSVGCVSVLSTKSSSNITSGSTRNKKTEKVSSTQSLRSFRDRSKEKKYLKHRPIKEFKLFRFLAIAPDGNTEGLGATFHETVPLLAPHSIHNESRPYEYSRSLLHKRNTRDCDTAHVLRRHAVNRSHITPPKVDISEDRSDHGNAIKLPAMTDGDNNDPDPDSDTCSNTCSTTSATCNSTKFSAPTADRRDLPKKGKSITFDENIDGNTSTKTLNDVKNGYTDSVSTYKSQNLHRVHNLGPKQIHVNIPQEDKKTYSQEIVRLTLRQDKNTTRVTSYMSDMQQGPSSKWNEQHFSDDTDEGFSSMTSSNNANAYENKEWVEHSRQLLNTIANNNFIKVRKKLKSSTLFTSE